MNQFDVAVIGAGPGGYVCAIRCAQLGLKVVIVEKDSLGGVCLNVGCIPSKALISASHFYHRLQHDASTMGIKVGAPSLDMAQLQTWKTSVTQKMSMGVAGLLKSNKVEVVKGEAVFTSDKEFAVGAQKYQAKNVVLATGSRPIEIPGFPFDEKGICSSTGALALSELPKRVAILGGGYIGLEIGGFLRKLGSEVYILEASPSLLAGVVDPECSQVVQKRYQKLGIQFLLNKKATQCSGKGPYKVSLESGENIEVDKVIVTVGRRPNGDSSNIKAMGIKIDARGFVVTDLQRKASKPGVYAIGDIAGQPMLAHKASYEGVMVAEIIAGQNRIYDAKVVPAVVFTDPEISSVGLSEDEARKEYGDDILVGRFPFAANGRAVSLMETDGFVKIIARKKDEVVLGVHMVGPETSQLIGEAALAIEMGARLTDLARTIHPHPTLSETIPEAAESALGHPIHIFQRPRSSEAKH